MNICEICARNVEDTKGILCKGQCAKYYHFECVNITNNELEELKNRKDLQWHCVFCEF